MQAEHSNSKSTIFAANFHLCFKCCIFYSELCLLCLPEGDFNEPFEIIVELKGVMQDASVTKINKVQPKSRMLHCGSVSVNQQYIRLSCLSLVDVFSLFSEVLIK